MIRIFDHLHREHSLTCDLCGEEIADSFYYFDDVIEYKKENGWTSEKRKDGEWEDICPECKEGE